MTIQGTVQLINKLTPDLKTPTIKPLILSIASILFLQTQVQAADLNQIQNQQTQNQQQRNDALQQSQQTNPTVQIDPRTLTTNTNTNPTPTIKPTDSNTPNAGPCFTINQIALTTPNISNNPTALANDPLYQKAQHDLNTFNFALLPVTTGKGSVLGKCMGLADINVLVAGVQNRIIDKGYATTRVVVGNQNLKSGMLRLTVIPGYIDQIKSNTKPSKIIFPVSSNNPSVPATFDNALPLKSGDLLNIRQLETGLENLKRVPTADANFNIAPSSRINRPGYSDVVIDYAESRRLRGGLGIDDSGTKATGKYQGNVTLSMDNPTWHNDLFYLSYSHDLNSIGKSQNDGGISGIDTPIDIHDVKHGSQNYALGYTLPWHNWLWNANASHYTYDQAVAGANQDYVYSGTSDNLSLNGSYLIQRDARSKTFLTIGGYSKAQNNYIDDTEVEVQRRKIAGWTTGIRHELSMGNSKLTSEMSYQHGTGAFDAIDPPEAAFNEGSARAGIYKASFDYTHPFKLTLGNPNTPGNFTYHANLKGQYADKALVPSERLSIGGRYTVRGFDGERTLMGDNGAVLRQELSAVIGQPTPTQSHSVYLALDAGNVSMKQQKQDELLLGHNLVGSAIGLKGQFKPSSNANSSTSNQANKTATPAKPSTWAFNYDVFAGYPLYQPKNFSDKNWVTGFSVGVDF